jgi:hypothetical protein
MASSGSFKWANVVPPAKDKSFLVLFFKKELLLPFAARERRGCPDNTKLIGVSNFRLSSQLLSRK